MGIERAFKVLHQTACGEVLLFRDVSDRAMIMGIRGDVDSFEQDVFRSVMSVRDKGYAHPAANWFVLVADVARDPSGAVPEKERSACREAEASDQEP